MAPQQRKPPCIYIVGAQCTGKTTLVNELQPHLRTLSQERLIGEPQVIREVARTVLREHQFVADDIRSSRDRALALQKLILAAQVEKEAEALGRSPWFISDRSAIDPIVYAAEYVSNQSAHEMQQSVAWLEAKSRMAKSLIIVCESGAKWLTDDGVRLMPMDHEEWLHIHRLFCAILEESRLQYFVLPCTMLALSDRVHFVLSKWTEMVEATEAGDLNQDRDIVTMSTDSSPSTTEAGNTA